MKAIILIILLTFGVNAVSDSNINKALYYIDIDNNSSAIVSEEVKLKKYIKYEQGVFEKQYINVIYDTLIDISDTIAFFDDEIMEDTIDRIIDERLVYYSESIRDTILIGGNLVPLFISFRDRVAGDAYYIINESISATLELTHFHDKNITYNYCNRH